MRRSTVQRAAAWIARRTFVVVDVTEIYVHWYAGRPEGERQPSIQRKSTPRYPPARLCWSRTDPSLP
ncbi:hypothetical protein [Streptomyces antimycoticus]|nr:hypothetical protein [Streptomyces antimycoticus]